MGEQTDQSNEEFSQEIDDLIDKAVEDRNAGRAVKRLEDAIGMGIPEGQEAAAYQVLGTRYEDLGDSEMAIDSYSKSLDLHPDNPIVWFWRGELLFRNGQHYDAKSDFERALEFQPPTALFSPESEQARDYLKQIGD